MKIMSILMLVTKVLVTFKINCPTDDAGELGTYFQNAIEGMDRLHAGFMHHQMKIEHLSSIPA